MNGPTGPTDWNPVAFGPFRLDIIGRLLKRDGVVLNLGSRSLDILICLVRRAGQIVGKEELIAQAWPHVTVEEVNLRFQIASLRKALGDGRDGARYVVNVSGRGYSFVAPLTPLAVTWVAPATDPSHHALPPRHDRMIGRDDDVQSILRLLSTHRLVTIHGAGGIGKTTVALAVGHAEIEAFDGSVCFLDLGSLTEGALLPGALASTLGLAVRSGDPILSVIAYLRSRRMLLILDNCEHVIEAAASLSERILREAPQVNLLATSREPLCAPGEWVFSLSPLGCPAEGADLLLSQVLTFPAARLFVERAAAAGFQSRLTDADAATLAKICRKLDGIALAIELVAGRVHIYGLSQTAALLEGELRLGWKGRRTAPSRHQTLEALLDWSYNLASETEQSVLRRFSIFVGAFTLSSAVVVAAADTLDETQVIAALEQLVAKSLVDIVDDGSEFRFRLLATTRSYAYARLTEGGDWAGVCRRHATHFLGALETRHATGGTCDRRADFKRLGDIRAALDWGLSDHGDAELASRLAAASAKMFVELSLLDECRHWTERALHMLTPHISGTHLEMQLQAALGHSLMFTSGNGNQARSALERSLHLAEELRDRFSQFRLLSSLHMCSRRTRSFNRLLPLAKRAETIATEVGDPVGIAGAHVLLGVSHHLTGNQSEARHHLEVSSRGRTGDVHASHFGFHRNPEIALARILWLQGYPDKAIEMVNRFPTEALADADPVTFCIALIWGASVFRWTGNWDVVENFAERLLGYADTHSLGPYQAVAEGLRGEILIHRGAIGAGIDLLRGSLASLHADQYELYTPDLTCTLATSLAATGHPAQGLALIDDCIEFSALNGESFDMPEMLRARGEILALSAQAQAAEECFRRAITLADEQGATSWRLRAVMSCARLHLQSGRSDEIHDELGITLERFDEGFETADLRAARRLLGEIGQAVGIDALGAKPESDIEQAHV